MTSVPRVLLSVMPTGPAPSGSAGAPRPCRGRLPPSPAPPGSGCPQLPHPCCVRDEGEGLPPPLQSQRLTAHRGVHRQPAADARSREGSPRARDRRAGHRRPEERATGAPAVRALLGQQRLAGLRRDRLQPHPRRRRSRRSATRPRDHRHHPRPAHHRARAAGPLSPTSRPAPAAALALGRRLAAAVHRQPTRTTGDHTILTASPSRARPHIKVEQPARPADTSRPQPAPRAHRQPNRSRQDRRWIRA